MTDLQKLKTNVARTQQQIEQAAQNSGRQAEEITLVAVTKYVDHQITRLLVEAGCKNLGENRPQQLWQKADQLSDCDVRWHQIGHLANHGNWSSLIQLIEFQFYAARYGNLIG